MSRPVARATASSGAPGAPAALGGGAPGGRGRALPRRRLPRRAAGGRSRSSRSGWCSSQPRGGRFACGPAGRPRLRGHLLLPAHRVGVALPRADPVVGPLDAHGALVRARHRPDRGRHPMGASGVPGRARAAAVRPARRRGAVDRARGGGQRLAVRRLRVGPRLGVAVRQPDRSAVRLARRLRGGIRDGVPGRGRAGSRSGRAGCGSTRGRCW